jgi:hypothetical protein
MNLVKVNNEDYGVEETKALEIQGLFSPMIDKMVELEAEYNAVVKLPVNEDTAKKARVLRLEYVKTKTGTAKIHKELKAPYLKLGQFLDNWKSTQKTASEGMEQKCLKIEKHFENVEAERIEELQTSRAAELEQYEVATVPQNLGEMADDVWSNFLTGSRVNFEDKKKAKRLEAERLEQAKIEAEKQAEQNRLAVLEFEKEQKRVKAENKRLKQEAQEKAVKAEKARAAAAEKNRKALAKKEAEIAKQKAAAEKLRKEKAEKEAELLAIEKEEKEKARKRAAAPDKEKLVAFGEMVANLELPELSTKHGLLVRNSVEGLLKKVNDYIIKQAENF